MLALALVLRAVVTIIMFFIFSAMVMAVLITSSSSAIIVAAIIPPPMLLLLIAYRYSAMRLIASAIFWRRHGGPRTWRRFLPMAVFVMVIARGGAGAFPSFPAGAGRDWDRVLFLASLPPP